MEPCLVQVDCARTVSAGFDNTALDFNLSVGVPNTVLFKKSFFRVDMSLYDNSSATSLIPLKPQALTAFADNAIGNLFTAASVTGSGQTLSKLTEGLSQLSALKSRLTSTSAWVKSMGKAALHESSFQKRLLAVSRYPSENDASPTVTQASMTGLGAYDDREIYKPYEVQQAGPPIVQSPQNFASCTVAIATTGIVTGAPGGAGVGNGTDFLTGMPLGSAPTGGSVLPGDLLVVNGIEYTIAFSATATDADTCVVSPAPVAAVAATTNWFIVRADTIRAQQGFNKITADWVPPLGIFDYDELLGPGNYKISLTPNSDYAKTAIETKDPNWRAAPPYRLVIDNVRFYAYISKMSIPDKVNDIEFREMKVFPKQYSETLQYTVPDSTYALSLFIQDPAAGYSPLMPPSMFKVLDNSDLYLTTLSINFGGITKPDTKWDSKYRSAVTSLVPPPPAGGGVMTSSSATLQLQQRYHDTFEESGLELELGGAESLTDYLRRGPFYHYTYRLDAANRATQVTVNAIFEGPLGKPASIDQCKVVLVAHFISPVQIVSKDGIIVDVKNRYG